MYVYLSIHIYKSIYTYLSIYFYIPALTDIFESADINGNGRISIQEIKSFLKKLLGTKVFYNLTH